jgi:hypothetical protein
VRKLIITIETPREALVSQPYPATASIRKMLEVIRSTAKGQEILNMLEPIANGAFHHKDVELILAAVCANNTIGGQLDTEENVRMMTYEVRVALAFDDRVVVAPVEPTQGVPDLLVPSTDTPLRRQKLRR